MVLNITRDIRAFISVIYDAHFAEKDKTRYVDTWVGVFLEPDYDL